MRTITSKPDSLIFDMDGTLWNALHIYTKAWNKGFEGMGIDKQILPQDISYMMGWEGRRVLDTLLPEYTHEVQDRIYRTVNEIRAALIDTIHGVLHPGVKDGLRRLASLYQLFIVSNCPKGLISLFMRQGDIDSYITDFMEYGENKKPKHHNIKLLMKKYNLKSSVYIGDTADDELESELAEVPFVFFSFGFGHSEKYALKFDDFESFTNHFAELANNS